jgi:hypothetical protein
VRRVKYITPFKKQMIGPSEALCIETYTCPRQPSTEWEVDVKAQTPQACPMPLLCASPPAYALPVCPSRHTSTNGRIESGVQWPISRVSACLTWSLQCVVCAWRVWLGGHDVDLPGRVNAGPVRERLLLAPALGGCEGE